MGKRNPKHVVGLDFGTDTIRAVQLTRNRGGYVLQRYHEIMLPAGAIVQDVIRNEAVVAGALRQLWRDARFSTKHVVLGLGNQQVLVRELVVQKMKLEHIHESLPFQVSNMLPIPVDQAVIQFYPTTEVEVNGQAHLRGLMIATARATVEGYSKLIRASGLKLVDIDYTSFGVLRGMSLQNDGLEIIVDVREQDTNLIIADAGDPRFIRYLANGSRNLTGRTHTLPATIPAGVIESEDGSVEIVTGQETAGEYQLDGEQLTNLVRDIRATILFYQNAHPEEQIANMVLLCDDLTLDGLDAALKAELGLPTRLGKPDAKFTFGRGVKEEEFLTTGSHLVASIGLSMRK